jgi:hypothetical protein
MSITKLSIVSAQAPRLPGVPWAAGPAGHRLSARLDWRRRRGVRGRLCPGGGRAVSGPVPGCPSAGSARCQGAWWPAACAEGRVTRVRVSVSPAGDSGDVPAATNSVSFPMSMRVPCWPRRVRISWSSWRRRAMQVHLAGAMGAVTRVRDPVRSQSGPSKAAQVRAIYRSPGCQSEA